MTIARRLIVAVCGTFQGFFSYGIIRRVNLFSDRQSYVRNHGNELLKKNVFGRIYEDFLGYLFMSEVIANYTSPFIYT